MTPEERKQNSENILRKKGVSVSNHLPCFMPASDIKLKSTDDICRRAVAALLTTQAAIMLDEGDTKQADFFIGLMEHFGVKDCLNQVEKRIVGKTCSQQDLTDIVWEYECFWALAWVLGLIDDITDAENICDCKKAINLVSQCESLDDFKNRCKLRSADEILDMFDLYSRYDWSFFRKKHIPNTTTGNIDGEVVYERRRALIWVISDAKDWYDIQLEPSEE